VDTDAFDRFEAAGWEQRAAAYDRHFSALTGRLVEPLLDAAAVKDGHAVLDIGCGPGHLTAACAARGAAVIGVDISAAMVRLAAERHPGIRFEQADAQRLPFDDASMDAVVGNFVILHVGRPERAVAEAVRVLRPGGSLALSVWDIPARTRLIGLLTDAVAEIGAKPSADIPPGPPFFRFADDGEFTGLLAGAGLVQVQVRRTTFDYRVGSAAELWDALLAGTVRSGALVTGQPDDVRARIRAAFERAAAQYGTGDGLDLPVSVTIASGTRPAAS
jgi:SAM-dependent methyltransferase